MNRHRLFVFGTLGAIALIAALGAIVYFSVRAPFDLAKSRWDAKGGGDYTLVVSRTCFCRLVIGEFKITVRAGRVTGYEVVNDVGSVLGPGVMSSPGKPSDLDGLTVAAMLAQAETDQRDLWTAPWTHQVSVDYDPTYGYVTQYVSNPNGQIARITGDITTDSGLSYTAHDLVLTGSAP